MKNIIAFIVALFLSAYSYASMPNILLIYADDLGSGDVSYGNAEAKIQTPNIDALADSGMRFNDAHSSAGLCSPSRFAMLTGQYHWRRFFGIVYAFGESAFKPDDFTIAKMLKSKGYNTACIGKWHLGWDWSSVESDSYKAKKAAGTLSKKDNAAANGVAKKGSKKASKKGSGSLENGTDGKPVIGNSKDFVSKYTCEDIDWSKPIAMGPCAQGFDYYYGDGIINFPPYAWIENDKVVKVPTKMADISFLYESKDHAGNFRGGPMAEGWNMTSVLPTLREKAVEYISKQSADKPFFLYLAFTSPHAPLVPTDEFCGKSKAGFYGDFVMQTDDSVGKVIAELERKGLRDNTIIIFSSDNGAAEYAFERQAKYGHWSSGLYRGVKKDLFEGGHHIPFILSWKGKVAEASESDALISQIDLAATFAAISGYELKSNEAVDSFNMLPLWTAQTQQSPRESTVYNTSASAFGLRQGDWVYINSNKAGSGAANSRKYIPSNQKAQNENTPALLYNLKDDIAQVNNLYGKKPEIEQEMKAKLKEIIKGKATAPHTK